MLETSFILRVLRHALINCSSFVVFDEIEMRCMVVHVDYNLLPQRSQADRVRADRA